MAEYYPLLAKAVGSLPNSTPESRRVVYERARKALIGQLRTLHPPVPDEDIERESVALDRAVERIESELANGGILPASAPPAAKEPPAPDGAAPKPSGAKPPLAPARPASTLSVGPGPAAAPGERSPPLLRPRAPKPAAPKPPLVPGVPMPSDAKRDGEAAPNGAPLIPSEPAPEASAIVDAASSAPDDKAAPETKPGKRDPQRPFAPQPAKADGPKRRIWIIPVIVGLVVALVAGAAWKLRDRPETIAKTKPAEQAPDSGKIAERVGGPPSSQDDDKATPETSPSQPAQPATTPQQGQAPATPPANNPAVPVAHRAALLVEAADEPNKVKTYLGTVVWKLNNVPQGQNDAVGLAVEADIELPDDRLKASVTFEKNTDASLPASHTIKVRFMPETGSATGDIKQISVPQMRPEASPSGEALAGVTVPVVQNSFLVGLSPGNAETANTDLIRRLQWIDVPLLLDNGKIAKLTFEKSDSGTRDLNEAFDAWQK